MTLGLAAASAMMVACNQNPNNTTANVETAAGAPNIVYVNSDSLLANYEYFKDVRDRLQGKAEQKEKDLRAQAESFQKEVQRYQESAAGMSQQQRANTEQRLAQKQQQLQALQQSSGNELVSEESEEMKKIYDRVEEYLKQLSNEEGYKMVLTYQRGNSAILYGDSTLDITEKVVASLNKTYETEKAESSDKKEEKTTEEKKK
ncbi:OmpH family outer membrane protein [Pontibacter oryzae]|uniref:OmpH family outer membrane protein n=1 Tax=Pontibacter oryzae TaxID=2304593 RepID=A0A399SEJ7_9BACT|nr:OmpH family outer membrane protein [Pontibacter oryzae]RIJ41601.1 OmpH family outer membrane protein [Pontibacter oryzae]